MRAARLAAGVVCIHSHYNAAANGGVFWHNGTVFSIKIFPSHRVDSETQEQRAGCSLDLMDLTSLHLNQEAS